MPVRLFVGGLSYSTSTEGLRDAFARYGAVTSAAVMTDRETGRSRGFGFVEMATDEDAERAIGGMNGAGLDGRSIRVDRAMPRGTAPASRPRPAGGPGGMPPRPPRPGGPMTGPRGPGWGAPPPPPGFPPPGAPAGRRPGAPRREGEGEQRRPGGRKPPGRSKLQDRTRGGRGRRGSDGEFRWGR
jgi:RNA recognition motif-containing protein